MNLYPREGIRKSLNPVKEVWKPALETILEVGEDDENVIPSLEFIEDDNDKENKKNDIIMNPSPLSKM